MQRSVFIALLSIFLLTAALFLFSCSPSSTPELTDTDHSTPAAGSLQPTSSPAPSHTATPSPTITPIPTSDFGFIELTPSKKIQLSSDDLLYDAAWSPDGSTAAIATSKGVSLLDGVTGNRQEFLSTLRAVHCVAFNPDGKSLVYAMGHILFTYDLSEKKSEQAPYGHMERIRHLAFNPGGSRMASAADDNRIIVWNTASRTSEFTLMSHEDPVLWVVFNPAPVSNELASSDADGKILIWDIQSRKVRLTLQGHLGAAYTLLYSPDGSQLYSGGVDGYIRIWDVQSGSLVDEIHSRAGAVFSLSSPDSAFLLHWAGMDGTVRWWSFLEGTAPTGFVARNALIYRALVSPDETRLLTISSDNTTWLFQLDDHQ